MKKMSRKIAAAILDLEQEIESLNDLMLVASQVEDDDSFPLVNVWMPDENKKGKFRIVKESITPVKAIGMLDEYRRQNGMSCRKFPIIAPSDASLPQAKESSK